jgi:hypothetical protein
MKGTRVPRGLLHQPLPPFLALSEQRRQQILAIRAGAGRKIGANQTGEATKQVDL